MRGHGPPVSEVELHGFVDGDLDRGRREAVQAFLAASPGDAAQVETWPRRRDDSCRFRAGRNRTAALVLAAGSRRRGVAAAGHATGGQAEARASHAWRERWFAQLIGLSFASGALLAASAAYLAGRVNAPEAAPPSSEGPTPDGMNDNLRHAGNLGTPGI